MNSKKRLLTQINKSALKSSAFLLIAAGIFSASPEAVYASTPNLYVAAKNTAAKSDDAFDKNFREGRDLIDKEEWAKAAEKFSEVIDKYPNDKSIDAALYWLAFCHKKQKRFKETDAALDRLLKEFPASSWANDARVMKMEIGFPLGKIYSSASAGAYSGIFSAGSAQPVGKTAVVNSLSAYTKSLERMGEGFTAAPQTPLDREDEIKIAAFQSLLAADPKRAIEVMGDILTSGSKASETVKREVLRVLRSPRVSGTQSLNFTVGGGVGKQFLPLLRETLVGGFQKESNIKIRKEIIYALANINDDQSADYLARLYASENEKEIKKAIINSFGSQYGVFYQFGNASAAFGAASSGGVSKRRIELDKLLEIIRAEKDGELRRLAFSKLQRFGSSANEQVLEDFVRLYDAETDEEFKVIIIRTFADIKQNRATTKLLDIARNDKSDKIKLEAIYALRTSKNPEALKFLEDLIK